MKVQNPVPSLVRLLACIGALVAASIGIVGSVVGGQQALKGAAIQFRAEQIASDFGLGYAVTTGDVNGDGRTDVVAINATDLVWFEAPSWQKRVILTGATPRDNVCLALHDIDRDGRLDVALGASWQPTNTSSRGTLHWVRKGAPGADWELHSIAEEPTLHRIQWRTSMATAIASSSWRRCTGGARRVRTGRVRVLGSSSSRRPPTRRAITGQSRSSTTRSTSSTTSCP